MKCDAHWLEEQEKRSPLKPGLVPLSSYGQFKLPGLRRIFYMIFSEVFRLAHLVGKTVCSESLKGKITDDAKYCCSESEAHMYTTKYKAGNDVALWGEGLMVEDPSTKKVPSLTGAKAAAHVKDKCKSILDKKQAILDGCPTLMGKDTPVVKIGKITQLFKQKDKKKLAETILKCIPAIIVATSLKGTEKYQLPCRCQAFDTLIDPNFRMRVSRSTRSYPEDPFTTVVPPRNTIIGQNVDGKHWDDLRIDNLNLEADEDLTKALYFEIVKEQGDFDPDPDRVFDSKQYAQENWQCESGATWFCNKFRPTQKSRKVEPICKFAFSLDWRQCAGKNNRATCLCFGSKKQARVVNSRLLWSKDAAANCGPSFVAVDTLVRNLFGFITSLFYLTGYSFCSNPKIQSSNAKHVKEWTAWRCKRTPGGRYDAAHRRCVIETKQSKKG